MTRDDEHALAIAIDAGLPYVGLRRFVPDPRLARYLPPALALAERIVPIVLVGDTLKVAAARPDAGLEAVRTRFPHLTVEIAISSAPDIDRALRRLASTS